MNIQLTNECKEWAETNLSAEQLSNLKSKIGLRASIASNPRAHGRNAGKNLNREVREEFGVPSGVAIFKRAPSNPNGNG